jgi:hypothetical protein
VSVPQAGVCTGVGCAAARLCQFDVVIGWQETAPINNLMVCFTDSLGFLTCVDHQAAQGLLSVKLSEKCGTDTQAQFIDAGTNTVIGQIDARCCNCFGGV